VLTLVGVALRAYEERLVAFLAGSDGAWMTGQNIGAGGSIV
jgi:hypothetical protein